MIYIATDNYNDGFPLSNAYDDTIYQKANAEYYLKFRFPVDRLGIWKHLTCETILKADDTRGLQLFKIKKINKINGYVRVYAKHITDDLNFIGVDKISVNNATGRRVMEALAGSTTEQHSFIFNSDVATMHTLNLTNTTAGKVLSKGKHSILGQWGGELIRDNFLVDLKARAGVDTEILFMNKKNVKNLDNAISTENITTRLKLSVEVEGEGNNKQTITATVDSPNINAYPRVYTNYLKVNSNNITTQEQLIEYGKKYFRDTLVDFPSDNLTVNVIDRNQERVNLFDTVWFRNVEFDIDKRLKVVAYEFSPMSKRYKKISFGALKVGNLNQIKSFSQLEEKIDEKITESFTDAFKIQKNLSQLLKLDRKGIEDKMLKLEEKSKGAVEVKRALFEADGTIPDVVKTKILDAVEGDIGRLKTIITEAELIKAIQAKLNFAEIKNALIDKAFINQIISDERFTQQFEDGQVTTQNIFTKLKDSIKSNISKEFVTKDGVRKLVNDLTIDADGIRQITQQESSKVFEKKKAELKGTNSYIHKKYSDYPDGRNMSDNSTLKYIGIYTGDKQQAPTNASEYSWTKIKVDGKLYKAYSNSLNGIDFTLVEPDENAKLFAKNRPRVNIINDNDISDIWQANMFLSFKPNTKYTLTARAKGNSNKLWAYFRNNRTSEEYSWGQLEFRGLETKSITFTTTNDVDDVLFKFVLVPEDEDWTGIQIDWFTIYEGDKRYTDYPVDEPAQYHKYRYFGYVFKEGTPVASDFEWFDLQQTSITNDKYTHIVYSDNADGSNFGREPKKYMGVARTTSPTQPTDKTAYKWFKVKGEDGERGRDGNNGRDGKSYARNYLSGTADEKILTAVNDVFETQEAFKLVDNKNFRDLGFKIGDKITFIADYEVLPNGTNKKISGLNFEWYDDNRYRFWMDQDLNPTKGTFTRTITADNDLLDSKRAFLRADNVNAKIKVTNARVIQGDMVQPWSIAQEDLQAHSLTANLRFEGTYINNITNNVKAYLDVFYDGKKVDNGFEVKYKIKGGNRTDWSEFTNANVDNTGRITNLDWGNREQNGTPLEVIVLVTYEDLNTIASERMESIPDVTEIKETIRKYRTFESTLERFNSTIGEVKEHVVNGNRNYITNSGSLSDKPWYGWDNWEKTIQSGTVVFTKIKSSGNIGFYLGLSELIKDEFQNETMTWGIDIRATRNVTFGAVGFETGGQKSVEVTQNWQRITHTFVNKFSDWYQFTFYNPNITFNVGDKVYVRFPKLEKGNVATEWNVAPEDVNLLKETTESSIDQTNRNLDLKVSKDNIISAINLSVERDENGHYGGLVKINADKVDIRGVLRAYTGEIGGFRIGYNYNDGGFWLTGANNFDCGINPGLNAGSRGAQLWAAWGNVWTQAGPNAWWVNAQGVMTCKNTPTFARGMEVYGRYIDTHGNDIQGDKTGGGKTTVIWWSQINSVKSAISDQRLKTNIKPTKVNALDILNSIEMVEFNWKKDGKFEKIGAIAQQVQSVDESFVVHDMDDKQTYNDYLRIKYYDTIPYLIKAVQELSEENNNLKLRLQKLEDKINGNI